MRLDSLTLKVIVALVIGIGAVDVAGYFVAHDGFRQAEVQFLRQDADSRARFMANVVDMRLHALGTAASHAAQL